VNFEDLDIALWEVFENLKFTPISDSELERIKNKIRTSREFENQGILNRAMNLCHFELLGDANGINEEHKIYEAINPNHLQEMAIEILQATNCSLLKVKAS
jgi:predicted Zn-dependent peptidase